MVDAVKAALRPEPEDGASPNPQTQEPIKAEGSDPAKAEAEKSPDDELSDDELKSLKPKTARAIERFRTQVSGLKTEVENLTPKVREYDRLVGFMKQNDMTPGEFSSGVELMALMKTGQYEEAYKRLTPIVQQLQGLVGEVLPADLQERVRLGYIAEQDARELHRSRTQTELVKQRAEQAQQKATEDREKERTQTIVRDVASTVSEWERAKKASDPDWNLKHARIDQLVRLKVYEEGYPQTKDAAVKMVEAIYADVTKEMRSLAPKPQEKQSVSGRSSSQTVAEPTNMLDAIRIGLRR
jgi:hypothetical protein